MTLYYKMRQILLQNATAILLQNATVITNCDDFITKCGSYYKMRCLLQIARVRTVIHSKLGAKNENYQLTNNKHHFVLR